MPETPHVEKHFHGNQAVRDIVIGMSDGLTVPFALAAGLSGAIFARHIVLTAGFAEIAAGAISMGLGGYLAAKGDMEHYDAEKKREYYEIETVPEREEGEIIEILEDYGLTRAEIDPINRAFRKNPDKWVDFMMRFELGLEKVEPTRAAQSARNIALSYIAGGLVPLFPYFFFSNAKEAFPYSVAATFVALLIFGYVKGRFAGANAWQSALRTALLGGLAAGAAFGIAKAINQ